MVKKAREYFFLFVYGRWAKWVYIFTILFCLFWFSLPSTLFTDPSSTVLLDRHGDLLGARIANDKQWRFPHNEHVPEKFRQCITHFEDRYFEYHPGINPAAMARALMLNIKAGKVVSGGSTITMQVIRLSRKGKSRTVIEKLIETVQAMRMEVTYSKDKILSYYASNAPFGGNVVGLDMAAWRYFGKRPDDLSWAESATLAVLPNSPSLIYPGRNQEKLLFKRNGLLKKLNERGVIDEMTLKLATHEPLPGKPHPLPMAASHLLDRVMREGRQGQRVRTTIDGHLQELVNTIIARYYERYSVNSIHNAAALVLEVETGSAIAYVGNTPATDQPEYGCHNDMITAPRSTGSILKPFLYANMLNEGSILPRTLVPDIPVQMGSFIPENYSHTYDGAVPAHRALARSLNIPAVKMLQQYGTGRFYYQMKRLGITTFTKPSSHYGLSIIIGGAEANLWELAAAYASMARTLNHYMIYDSKYAPEDFHPANYLYENQEALISRRGSDEHSVLDAASIYFTFQAMNEVSRPDEDLEWQQFSSSSRVAWKTGTSYGSRDAWSIGVTPQYVVAVWVGNASGEGRPGLTGLNHAAPVLFEILKILKPRKWFYAPFNDMARIPVCHQSGYKLSNLCEYADTIYAPARGVKCRLCPYHQMVHLDKTGQWRVNSQCESVENMTHQTWFVLPPVMEYFYKAKNPVYKTLPPLREDCQTLESGVHSIDMIYPKNGSSIYIPLDIDGTRSKVVFRAAHRQPSKKIYWYVDEVFMGTTTDFHQMGLSPPPGEHKLTLTDQDGETLTCNFTIIDMKRK